MWQYEKLLIAADNSQHSSWGGILGVEIAKRFGSTVVGCHAYAAKMHDRRFKQMEYTLPEEYQEERELERQRRLHEVLITKGLYVISESYLDVIARRCWENDVRFEYKHLEGRNFRVLVDEVERGDYDLITLGALGMGAVKESLVGSVTERVVKRLKTKDAFIVKNSRLPKEGDRLVVAIDGSPYSFGALMRAIALAQAFDMEIEAVAAFDPYFHYAVFHSISRVLSERAGKIFKYEEQEQLHEEVIDKGLAVIYQSHLNVAKKVAEEEGIEIKTQLLDGKAFEKVIHYVRERDPWALLMGRIGYHSDDDMDIGSNTENLLRSSPCNMFVVSRQFIPKIDLVAQETIGWTEEASLRMERVPEFARRLAKSAIYRYALEKGHSVISSSVIDRALEEILPESAKRAMGIVSQAKKEEKKEVYECRVCSFTSKGKKPMKCSVCGSQDFRFIEPEDTSALKKQGLIQEETFDGVSISWTKEAKERLNRVPAGYMRDRARAKVEKSAKTRGVTIITEEFVSGAVEDSIASLKDLDGKLESETTARSESWESDLTWTEEAVGRLERVPEGFMRNITKFRIEEYAGERKIKNITLRVAEEGIAEAKKLMELMIKGKISKEEIEEMEREALAREETKRSEIHFYICGSCNYLVKDTIPEECNICSSSGTQFRPATPEEQERFELIEEKLMSRSGLEPYRVCTGCGYVAKAQYKKCPICGVDTFRSATPEEIKDFEEKIKMHEL